MSSIGTYGFINAKVRTMRSFLISPSMYLEMIEARDLKTLHAMLGDTPYKDVLKIEDAEDLETLESLLMMAEVQRLNVIAKYSKKESHHLIQLLLERFDNEKIKILLRFWHAGKKQVSPLWQNKILYALPPDALLSAKHFSEFLLLLQGTPFQEALSKAASQYDEKKSLFPLELALDKRMFRVIFDSVISLKKKDRTIANRLLGIEVDLKNLDWIHRYRSYYEIVSAKMIDLLLPYGHRFTSGMIRKIISGDDIFKVFSGELTGLELPTGGNDEDAMKWDTLVYMLYMFIFKEAKKAFSEFPFSIGSILGYYYLMRIETRNLIALFYAKQYGLSVDQIKKRLVF